MKKILGFVLITFIICPYATLIAENQAAEATRENLQLVKKGRHRELLLDTLADWGGYSKFQLDKASVEFRKNWALDQRNRSGNRPTEKDMEAVKASLADLLGEVLTSELSKNGALTLTENSGENVMRITPHVVDLDVYAPDRMRAHIGFSLTDSNGHMTLVLEIHDSVNGALLARASDFREDPRKGYLEWTTSVNNRRAARLMLIRWAKNVNKWLEEAREGNFDS